MISDLHTHARKFLPKGRQPKLIALAPPNLDRMHEAVVEMQFPIQARAGGQTAAPKG